MKPRLFIGSSAESLSIAYAIQMNLERDVEVTVWTQGIFDLSKSTLESLAKATKDFHAAVFVFAPDDIAKIRRTEFVVPRDNVVFELGLFMGSLGIDRVFFVIPAGVSTLHLPTDLLGITPATFDPNRSDNNLQAALGPACHKIRTQLSALSVQSLPRSTAPTDCQAVSDDAALAIIDAWLQRSLLDVLTRPLLHAAIDEQLLLPPGTSARLTQRAVLASKRRLKVAADTGQMIQIVAQD